MVSREQKFLSVLLSALLLLSAVCFTDFSGLFEAHAYSVGDIIEYGTYPQSRVTNTTLIGSLNGVSKTWKSYRYFSGTGVSDDGKMLPSDYMKFADFFYNGVKYRAVTFTAYRPENTGGKTGTAYSVQDNNGYTVNQNYYFKYEPIQWVVLNNTGLMVTAQVLDAQAYQNIVTGELQYWGWNYNPFAYEYAPSSIRTWLNRDFYETAFTATQKNNIRNDVLLDNGSPYDMDYSGFESTRDKIFLLSESEARLANSVAEGTAYAKCQGFNTAKQSNGGQKAAWWWLRTPSANKTAVCLGGLGKASAITYTGYVYDASIGVRAACRLRTVKNDTSVSSDLFSQKYPEDANILYSGFCEQDIKWTVDTQGELRISGTWGDIYDGLGGGEPMYPDLPGSTKWNAVNDKVRSIVVEPGVDGIGPEAFSDCFNATSAVIPDSVTEIGYFLFCDCSSLKTVTIGKGITYIPDDTFLRATSLETVYYTGTRAQWNAITVQPGNDMLKKAKIITSDSVLKSGDADGDGNITAADARLALRRSVNLETFTKGSAQYTACDVDKDGKVTAADARLILRAAVGLETLSGANPCASGHRWNNGVVTKQPTCGKPGERTYICTVCGNSKTETIPATGDHRWNSGVVTSQPTTSYPGLITYTCTVCGEEAYETIPMLYGSDAAEILGNWVTRNGVYNNGCYSYSRLIENGITFVLNYYSSNQTFVIGVTDGKSYVYLMELDSDFYATYGNLRFVSDNQLAANGYYQIAQSYLSQSTAQTCITETGFEGYFYLRSKTKEMACVCTLLSFATLIQVIYDNHLNIDPQSDLHLYTLFDH